MFVVKYRKLILILTAVFVIGSVAILAKFGLKPSIDFTGGSLIEVSYEVLPEKADLEARLLVLENTIDLGGFTVQEAKDETDRDGFMIRTKNLTEDERAIVTEAVTSVGEGGEVSRFTSIGPVMGKELRDKASWAVVGVTLIVVVYIAFAFAGIAKPISSLVYGLVTICVLIFDILLPASVISALGHTSGVEVDILFLTALLAILGYSVNNTIVIIDRIRENQIKSSIAKKIKPKAGEIREETEYILQRPYDEIVGESVSQTMGRTINTSVSTIIVLFAIYFLGGEVTKIFTLTFLVGVLSGIFSSICLANALLVTYHYYQLKQAKAE
jgi:preprotein translocase subunit SecF